MKNIITMAIIGLLLTGCGSTRTTYHTDKQTGAMVPVATEERSFFASENLSDHNKLLEKKSDNHLAAVNAKLNALKENIAARMTTIKMTATEAILMSVIDSQQLASVPVDPPPDNTKAPKTMADAFDGNFLLNALNTTANWYNVTRTNKTQSKNDGDDGVTINNNGSGDFFWKSNGNKTNTFSLDNGSSGTLDTSNKKSDTTTTDSHDETDNSTSTTK
jgi:hypothetical protein